MLNKTACLALVMICSSLLLCIANTSLWAQSSQLSAITFKDQENVEKVIRKYINALEKKDYAIVWELTSSDGKKVYPKSEFIKKDWGINFVKLINMRRCLISASGFTFEVPKDTPTICFSVTLNIKASPDTAWENGLNDRLVDVVKEKGTWRINGLNTGP